MPLPFGLLQGYVSKFQRKAIQAEADDTVRLAIEPVKEWPEPNVPTDLKSALAAAPQAHTLWLEITPSARWDWIRWIRSTKQAETEGHVASTGLYAQSLMYQITGCSWSRRPR